MNKQAINRFYEKIKQKEAIYGEHLSKVFTYILPDGVEMTAHIEDITPKGTTDREIKENFETEAEYEKRLHDLKKMYPPIETGDPGRDTTIINLCFREVKNGKYI